MYSILDQLHIPLRIFAYYVNGDKKSLDVSINNRQVTVKHEKLEPHLLDLADRVAVKKFGWKWQRGSWVFDEGTKLPLDKF